MSEAGIDMWLIICQEDDLDPVYKTMVPRGTYQKILHMIIFYAKDIHSEVERINLGMTDMGDLYEKPWNGSNQSTQWQILKKIIEKRDPKKIGINIGETIWASGGLTHNLYNKLTAILPKKYVDRLVSAEKAVIRWGMTLTEKQLDLYPLVSSVARNIISHCYSPDTIQPGVTKIEDLEWLYWQIALNNGLQLSFKPYYRIIRRDSEKKENPLDDGIIRRGDLLICDVGVNYLGLYTDHQELAYVRYKDEKDAPPGLKDLLTKNNRLQQIFMREFKQGLTGNQIFQNIISSAIEEGIPSPEVFSHSLGLFVHEPGPVIGLPWLQDSVPGRGDVMLTFNSCYAMELCVKDKVPEWNNQRVPCQTEHIVKYTEEGCNLLDGVQLEYHLI
jgi:hypothetical protein